MSSNETLNNPNTQEASPLAKETLLSMVASLGPDGLLYDWVDQDGTKFSFYTVTSDSSGSNETASEELQHVAISVKPTRDTFRQWEVDSQGVVWEEGLMRRHFEVEKDPTTGQVELYSVIQKGVNLAELAPGTTVQFPDPHKEPVSETTAWWLIHTIGTSQRVN